MKHGLIFALLAALAGCQTCREHKVDCAMAGGLVVGAVLVHSIGRSAPTRTGDMPAICRTQPSACQ